MQWLSDEWRAALATVLRHVRNVALFVLAGGLIWTIVAGDNLVALGNFAVKIACLFVAAELAMIFLRRIDRRQGIDFKKDIVPVLLKSSIALAIYRSAILIATALVLAAALSGCAAAASMLPSKYDAQIRRASERFMERCGGTWHDWWGQIMTESAMDPAARSPVGAEGLAQFMPATAAEVFPLIGYQALDRRLAGPSIDAGAFYMGRLCGTWSAPRPPRDRHALAAASYNAGAGHILDAQRRCGMPVLYAPIMACLQLVTGRHAAETRAYWPRIELWARRKRGGV